MNVQTKIRKVVRLTFPKLKGKILKQRMLKAEDR
jgi:hypothetical protein